MGLDLACRYRPALDLLLLASEAAGVDLPRLLDRGGRELQRTEVLQPALTAVSLGAHSWLQEVGVSPQLVAGHSLGELAAWAATGAISPRDAVQLAAARGQLMAREAERNPGGMLALLDPGHGGVERALELGRRHGMVDLAAHNATGEWVLAGDLTALKAVAARTPSRLLPVSGAWHGRAMAGAQQELGRRIQALPRGEATATLVCNASGLVEPAPQIPRLLAGQLTAPVQWARTMETLLREGVTDLVTLGPGKVLRGLVRKNLGGAASVHGTDGAPARQATQRAIPEGQS